MRFTRICRNAALLLTAVVTALYGPGFAETAHADSTTKPFFQRTQLAGGCGAASLVRTEYNVYRTPTTNDQDWFYVDHTSSNTGELQTDVWVRNSYDRYNVYLQCQGGKRWRLMEPINYVHKEKYVNFHCDPHCVPLLIDAVVVTNWKQQYCGQGTNGMVCMW